MVAILGEYIGTRLTARYPSISWVLVYQPGTRLTAADPWVPGAQVLGDYEVSLVYTRDGFLQAG